MDRRERMSVLGWSAHEVDERIAELEDERDKAVARCAVLVEALNSMAITSVPSEVAKSIRDIIASTTDAERELLAYKRAWERYRNEPRDAYLDHVADEMDAILKEEQAK